MKKAICLIIWILFLIGCSDDPVPKPRAYIRIDLPAKKYQLADTLNCPFRFELPQYAHVLPSPDMQAGEKCWLNIYFPRFNGEIYLTYKEINSETTLQQLLDDLHKAAYTHQVRADNITSSTFEERDKKKFGLIYEVEGNVASQMQFCITDSTRHFVRGSLYFATVPNKDSLAPVVKFIREDIYHLMQTFQWK